MYERFFHLRERPFALSPDPDYLYPSRVHREALGYLRYGIESQAGFVVITGEIGSGKTTLLQALLRGLDGQTTVIRLMNTLLEPRELLEAIAIDMGFEPTSGSKPALLRDLANRLVDERAAGRLVLLVIDEAQNLGLPALEEIRMLSNLETEKSKLIQIVLVGQPDLRDKLNLPALEQLRQRITVSYHLTALDASETEAYVNHRLRRAALGAPLQFPRDVTDRIHARARGVPRLVNVVCDAVLVFAYAEERHAIDRPLLEEALQELEATGVLPQDAAEQAAGAAAEGRLPQPETGGRVAAAALPLRETGTPLRSPEPEEVGIPLRSVRSEPEEVGTPLQGVRAPEQEVPTASMSEARPVQGTPVDAEKAQEVIAKEAMLRTREEQLRRREEQLAQQRRVLADEYRLFRTRQSRDATLAAVEPAARETAWPPAPRPHARPAHAARAAARPDDVARFDSDRFDSDGWAAPPRPRGFWQRVKEVLLGAPLPVEDRR